MSLFLSAGRQYPWHSQSMQPTHFTDENMEVTRDSVKLVSSVTLGNTKVMFVSAGLLFCGLGLGSAFLLCSTSASLPCPGCPGPPPPSLPLALTSARMDPSCLPAAQRQRQRRRKDWTPAAKVGEGETERGRKERPQTREKCPGSTEWRKLITLITPLL